MKLISFNDKTKSEKSALSMHAKDKHKKSFSRKNLAVAVVKRIYIFHCKQETVKRIFRFD